MEMHRLNYRLANKFAPTEGLLWSLRIAGASAEATAASGIPAH
jgi:hypothetical protein